MSDPHIFRDEETVREYGRRLKEIEREMQDLDAKISELEKEII
jgi:predicted RNase H-like nuclease (RuvC/YqgF family)